MTPARFPFQSHSSIELATGRCQSVFSHHEEVDLVTSSHPDPLTSHVDGIISRFDSLSAARDSAVGVSRQVIRCSANAIRALHRGDDAAPLLTDAGTRLESMLSALAPYPALRAAGYAQDAMKEYAEAAITSAILASTEIPGPDALRIDDAAWLNGLAESASELRRDVLDALRANEIQHAESLLGAMDAIYAVLVTVDFPDAITGGLRRTTDQLRAVLERTRGDVTMSARQSSFETTMRNLESQLKERSEMT